MNSLVVLFNTLSTSSIGCYGAKSRTPAFDEIAACGDIYTNCYTDERGAAILRVLEGLPTTEVSDSDSEIDFSAVEMHVDNAPSRLVVRVACDLDVDACDHILKKTLDQTRQKFSSEFHLIVTSLEGHSAEENPSSKSLALPGELATHVPLIVSTAGQEASRRRSELITTEQAAKVIECLSVSTEAYQQYRDSLFSGQITYQTSGATATRTKHWLQFQLHTENAHGETVQKLFRKPDDIWEILDVADQYPQVIEHFAATGELTFPDSV